MKKHYEKPVTEMLELESADIILTSGTQTSVPSTSLFPGWPNNGGGDHKPSGGGHHWGGGGRH